jgi:chitinase
MVNNCVDYIVHTLYKQKEVGMKTKNTLIRWLTGFLCAASLWSCTNPFEMGQQQSKDQPVAVARSAAAGQTNRRVVGYFVEWGIYGAHDNYYVTSIPFDKITHVNYAFVGINPTTFGVEVYDPWASLEIVYPGESWDTPYKGNLGMLRKMKLQYPNVKVLISVGGWTKSHGFHAAAMTESSRKTTAKNLVAFMKQYGLDGIDIDWEYPGINRPADPNDQYDKGAPGGPEDLVNFPLFLKAIREELNAQGAVDGRYYELTAAIGVGYDKIAVTDPAEYSKYLDALNLMTYDMHGGFETVIGHQAPLYSNPYDTHETLVNERYNIDWAVKKFLSLGVPANKLVLGIPFYSRGWNNVSGGWDVNGDGKSDGMFGTGGGTLSGKWGIGGQSPYFTIKQLEQQAGWEKFRDPYSKVPWLFNRSTRELYTYDDAISVAEKMDYIIQNNLGGAMYWEFDGDDWKNGYDLVNIIANKMFSGSTLPQDQTPPTVPANLRLTSKTSTSVSLSWDPSTDANGIAGYEVLLAESVKTTTSTTSVTITGLSSGTSYTFSVRAFDPAGNRSASSATLTVTTDTGGTGNPDNPPVENGPATGIPGTPFLEQTKWNGEATFSLRMNMWWGNNGTKLELLENGVVVITKVLIDNSPNPQSAVIEFTNKPNGTYRYKARLSNRFGSSESAEISYTVTQGSGGSTGGSSGGNDTGSGTGGSGNDSGTGGNTGDSGGTSGGTAPAWTPGTYYATGAVVSWNNYIWTCRQAHTALVGWEPGNVPALWLQGGSAGNSGDTGTPAVPGIPGGLSATVLGTSSILVQWNTVNGATGYDVEADGTVFTSVTAPWTHSGLAAGSSHKYRVRAKNSAGVSSWSNEIQAITNSGSGNSGNTNTLIPKRIMSGYWHTWSGSPSFIKLRDVNASWDVINIAFAEPVRAGSGDGQMKFVISGLSADYTINDFKNDIKLLQSRGKKIVLSIGGYEGYFSLDNASAVSTFVNNICGFVSEYGFDGIDIDLEQTSVALLSGADPDFRNPLSPKVTNMISAIRQICDRFGSNFILSWAPETFYLQMGHQFYAGLNGYVDNRAGCFIPMIHALRDKTTYVQAQLYNSGSIMGNDDRPYSMGTVEGIVAMCEMLINGFTVNGNSNYFFPGLRADQIVIAVPASASAAGSGQISNENLQRAFGILEARYPGIRGIMAWSINWDNFQNNNNFAISNRNYLNTLQ